MSPQPHWAEHVPPATGTIPCGGEEHRLTWARGKLKLEDHELGNERAMLVLGGEPCACLRALRLWADQFGMPPEVFGQMQSWIGDDGALAPAEFHVHRLLGMLLNWERAWKAGRYLTKHGKLIERELRPLALPVLKAHLNAAKTAFGSRVIRAATVEVVPAGRRQELRGQMDRISVRAEATLSTDWVLDVWARGMATIDDTFVLGVLGVLGSHDPGEPSQPASLEVAAVRWVADGGTATPAPGVARLDPDGDGGWALTWLQEPGRHRPR